MPTLLEEILIKPEAHVAPIFDLVETYGVEAVFAGEALTEKAFLGRVVCAVEHILDCRCGEALRIYRAISVPPEWEPTWLGRHWTTRRDQAYPHDGDGADFIVVEALVSPDDIDTYRSVVLHMLVEDFCEHEILVRPDAVLEVVSIVSVAGVASFNELWGRSMNALPPGGRPLDGSWQPLTGRFFGQ